MVNMPAKKTKRKVKRKKKVVKRTVKRIIKKKIKRPVKKRTRKKPQKKKKAVKRVSRLTLEKIEERREDYAKENQNRLNKLLEEMKTDMFSKRQYIQMKRSEKYKQRRGETNRRAEYGFRKR